MSNTVGEVNINLRMSLAQFRNDVKQGTGAASQGAKDMAGEIGKSSHEAQASLALIGDQIGITIPRHLRAFIAQIPGVSQALNSAFTSIAIIALIGLLVEVIAKVEEVKQKAIEGAEAWATFDSAAKDALTKLNSQLLEAERKIDELKDNHIAALQKALQLIDAQTLDAVGKQFEDLGKKVDDAFTKSKANSVAEFFGKGGNKQFEEVKAHFDDILAVVKQLQQQGDNSSIGNIINQERERAQSVLNTIDSLAYKNDTYHQSLKDATTQELDALNQLYAVYQSINKVADTNKAADKLTEQKREAGEATKELQKLNSEMEGLNKELDKVATHHNVIGQSLGNGNIDPTGIFHAGDVLQKGPQSSSLPPVFGGTKEAEELHRITVDQNAAIAEAQKVYTGTRTATEQYAQEMSVLNELLRQGKIDQDTYNRAAAEAKQKADTNAKALQQFGQDIGETLKSAVLFGKGWKDAFGSIAIELTQLILKMTLFKSLGAAGSAGGGGFFSSLLSGLSGHFASGGEVNPNSNYLVGENGPEIFSPKTAGQIIPMHGGQGGKSEVNNNEFHFHGVTDMDSFKRSQGQISAQMAAMLQRHSRRNS